MQRIKLITTRKSTITPDTAEALRHLERAAAQFDGVKLAYKGPGTKATWNTPRLGATGLPAPLSMYLAGRELNLRIQFPDRETSREEEVATLWGLAVPLGFTPWNRYPVPGAGDEVFHFLGPWQGLYDHLASEGRGELAWSSVCAAALCDVGRWKGTKMMERFVQAQLHRVGLPCGPIDGQIGPKTLAAIQALGLKGLALGEVARQLLYWEVAEPVEEERRFGHVLLPGREVAVSSYGKIATQRTKGGVALTVDGPGRVIIDVRPREGAV